MTKTKLVKKKIYEMGDTDVIKVTNLISLLWTHLARRSVPSASWQKSVCKCQTQDETKDWMNTFYFGLVKPSQTY